MKTIRVLCCAGMMAAAVGAAGAGPVEIPQGPLAVREQTRVSLNLRNIDIIDALKYFSLKSGMNIVPTQKVSGRVSLSVDNVPVKDVLDIMLRSNSLAYDKRGDIYNVMTEPEYKALYGRNFSDTRQVKVFKLKYAVPEQAFNLLDAIKSDIGRLLAEPESGAVMLIDTPEKIAEAQTALNMLEQKNNIKVFDLKYAKAKDIEDQLKSQLDLKKVGVIKADDRTNQVIVQTLPDRMGNIADLIKSLDKKTKAVLISTKIIKIKLTNEKDTGVSWEGLFNLAQNAGMTYVGSYPFSGMTAGMTAPLFRTRKDIFNNPAGTNLPGTNGQVGSYPFSGTTSSLNSSTKTALGQNMHVGIVSGKRDFDVLLNFLKTIGNTKVMANPSIAVVNNQEAKIHIGERRAYITTTTTTGSTTSTVSEEVTYVDVGVRMSVTPTINDDGYITMKIKPEISSVIGSITSSSNNIIPIIDTNTAETTVLAKDRSTIIIGGLGSQEVSENSEGPIGLSSIPLIGNLFKNKTQTKSRVELIIMITPVIFEGDAFVNAEEAVKMRNKPLKQFDVFRPEVYENGMPVLAPLREDLLSKGFRSDGAAPPPEEAVPPSAAAVTPSASDELGSKGFRSYN